MYQKIISTVTFDENYLILIGCDSYDVPFKGRDGEVQEEASDETFTYILCAVCPVKLTKPNLCYVAQEREFHDSGASYVASAPEMGFMFPAFDNRATNIYNALFYTHSPKDNHEALVQSLFHVQAPKCAMEQKKSFEALLSSSLYDSCSLEVVQNVHEQICQCMEIHKEAKVPEPLLIDKEQVKQALTMSGVPEKNIAKFSVDYDEAFGFEAQLHPKNIINDKRFEISMPDISIKVAPEKADLIETRVIGGVKYLLICADEDVEVNGVRIHIDDK